MSLRENERRILAEIEYRLSEDDPELAENLSSLGSEQESEYDADGTWKPWLVYGAIAVVVACLLVVLSLGSPEPAGVSTPTQPAPESVAPRTVTP